MVQYTTANGVRQRCRRTNRKQRRAAWLYFATGQMANLRTIARIPELRLHVRTGGELLDREISRIHGTELPDPGRYLTAGELVLTGLLWWHGPGDADPFVAAIARAGAAGPAASGADSGGIPDELVHACARHPIPLFEVAPDLSFAVITERVVLALAADAGGARRRLLSAATDGASLPSLLRRGCVELAAPCWVVSATGRVVAGTPAGSGPHPHRVPAGRAVHRAVAAAGGGRDALAARHRGGARTGRHGPCPRRSGAPRRRTGGRAARPPAHRPHPGGR